MDLVNYVLLIGKIYIWDCRRKENKPVIAHLKQITTPKSMLQKIKINDKHFFKKWNVYKNNFFKSLMSKYLLLSYGALFLIFVIFLI